MPQARAERSWYSSRVSTDPEERIFQPMAARRVPVQGHHVGEVIHRAFAIDVLACGHCGGRLRLIATLHDPVVVRKILTHLGMAHSGPSPGPAGPSLAASAP